jgi:hypothetical protein
MKEFTVKVGDKTDLLEILAELVGGEGTAERIKNLTRIQLEIRKRMEDQYPIPRHLIEKYNKIISELYPDRHE